MCLSIAVVLGAMFLRAVGEFYHPGFGFTALIGFPPDDPRYTPPQLAAVPHYTSPAYASYDGQFYALRALDPLARNPAIDRAMDLAPYRTRRILFSWTAYLLGFGRPTWILEAFALQNVACWFALAFLLRRWIDPGTPRGLALWTACLFSHGLLWSVRLSLLDGPTLLLIGFGVLAVERGWPLLSAGIIGVAVLGRETNVLAALAQPMPRSRTEWRRVPLLLVLLIGPVLVWLDYLRSIYRSTLLRDTDQLTRPGAAFLHTMSRYWPRVLHDGLFSFTGLEWMLLVATSIQAVYVLLRPAPRLPWWRVAIGYVALMLALDRVLWDPHTGAITRVLLPLTVGFNILLQREAAPIRFWPWFVLGNLHLVAARWVLPVF